MAWELTGDQGTNPPTDFIGTTDNMHLVIKTRGEPRMWIDADGNVGIGPASPQPDMNLHVEGVSLLGGPNYNSHLPWTDNNVYITSKVWHLWACWQGFRRGEHKHEGG